jgi:hypothetical protein
MMNKVRATGYASSRQGISETMASGIPQFSPFHKTERRICALRRQFHCSIFGWKSGSSRTAGGPASGRIKFCLIGTSRRATHLGRQEVLLGEPHK